MDLYSQWAEYATGPTPSTLLRTGEVGITLIYGSMYGNTEKMMNTVAQGISQEKREGCR